MKLLESERGFTPILILVIVVLIAAVGIGGYFYSRQKSNHQTKPEQPQLTKTSKQTSTPNPTASPITTNSQNPTASDSADISNWKTYTNNTYHFSFKYPPQFILTSKPETIESTDFDGKKINILKMEYSFSTGKIIEGQPDYSGFSINVVPTLGKTISQEYEGQQGAGGLINLTSIPSNGAAEADLTTNIENGDRIYRVGNNFFEVGSFQNANLLPDNSDDIGPYFKDIWDSITFSQ